MLIGVFPGKSDNMGKDKEGKFHPAKGKPSGANKQEGLGLRKTLDPDQLERDEQLTARYTPVNEDTLSPDVHLLHPNRNTSKGENSARLQDPSNKSRQESETESFSTAEPEELIGIIHKDLFNYLSSYQADVCVSILLPTHSAGVEVNEQVDMIAFKNNLQQVEKTLQQKNIDAVRIKKMLQPGYDLLRDDAFWKNQSQGLAVYMSDDFFKFIRLSGTIPQEILVNSSFLVSPLVPFMVRKEFFYLLVVSKKNSKFYRADAFGIEHIPVDELPTGVDDVVRFENKDDQKLFRTGGQGNKGAANFHGMGAGKPDEKQHIAVYLEEVDDTLWKSHLHYSTAPLLLAGLDHLIPIYRSVSDYKHIWPEALTGNYQAEDINSLYREAMTVMQPYFDQNLQKALNDYGNKSATPLTSASIREVIPAAFYGKISHLFVEKDAHIWGTFKEDTNELTIFQEMKDGAENLADKATAKTIQNGGEVFILDKGKMPDSAELAAIFRY